MRYTLRKSQRLNSRKAIEELFAGADTHTASSYPLRAVYRTNGGAGIRILVSVSKRHFKHAVDRNRCKRQIREAYRLNQHMLSCDPTLSLDIAIIWISPELQPSHLVNRKLIILLEKILCQIYEDSPATSPEP